MRICHVLGLPGAGKSTVADALSAQGLCRHLSAGQWLRDRMAAGDKAVADQLQRSATMDKALFLRFLRESLTEPPKGPELLLIDGAPRTPSQVSWQHEVLRAASVASVMAIHLDIMPTMATQRLTARASRPGDGDAAAPARRIAAEELALSCTLTAFRDRWPLATVNANDGRDQVISRVRGILGL